MFGFSVCLFTDHLLVGLAEPVECSVATSNTVVYK